jgi:hypothetical protein
MANWALTVPGGGTNGLPTLSHSEFQAAQHALSKIGNTTGTLGVNLGSLSRNATSIGGSGRLNALNVSKMLPGSGSDTFLGGARSSLLASTASDTITGGSTRLTAGGPDVLGVHNASSFGLSADTINLAGTTALSVRGLDPAENVKGHTVAVGDKTTITINGLSAHDISKLSH